MATEPSSTATEAVEGLTFGERLRRLRKATGCQQGEVAAAIGVTTFQISRWENGASTNPSMKRGAALAKLFGVTLDYLWFGTR